MDLRVKSTLKLNTFYQRTLQIAVNQLIYFSDTTMKLKKLSLGMIIFFVLGPGFYSAMPKSETPAQ